jgi:hypothetical protein
MTPAARTTHLGGIGLMLEIARICPRCGKHLSDSPSAATWHVTQEGCRPTVYAALPEEEPAEDHEDIPLVPAGRRIRDFEAPVLRSRSTPGFAAVEAIPPARGSQRSLAIPWLPPPDLGEVL